ncbi:hypothetical protein OHA72_45150 [Dactylosporangium sp. NBC_01737]|uniref:hypothetical protein n=1 Tax=Dactylosporangium sp. NBC_01737 TaxID=2975959 RepID=UPI002E142621|nr:hypothetical protein OHA72_45150 [Dactylosporangium sp. NBC_01737]
MRAFRPGFQQTERLQRFEAFEAVRDVDAGRAGEQGEVHVAADERGDMQQVASSVVATCHPVADDVSYGGRYPGRHCCLAVAQRAAVAQQPGQLPDEERIAGRTGLDELPEGDQVQHAGRRREQVGVAAAVQV